MFWDFSEPVARSLASQRAQYATGGLLLLISFCFQIAAALASSNTLAPLPQWLHTWPCLVSLVLVCTAILSYFGCLAIDRLTIKKVLHLHKKGLKEQGDLEKSSCGKTP